MFSKRSKTMKLIKKSTYLAAVIFGAALFSPNHASAGLLLNGQGFIGTGFNGQLFNGTGFNGKWLNGAGWNGTDENHLNRTVHAETRFNLKAFTIRDLSLKVTPQRPEAK